MNNAEHYNKQLHNFANQKTFEFKSFADDEDIDFPIEFCVNKCEALFLLTRGADNLNLAVDFYDGNGNIYTQEGCGNVNITLNAEVCDMFDIDVTKIDTSGGCCTYLVEVQIGNGCGGKGNPAFDKVLNGLHLNLFGDDTEISVNTLDNFIKNESEWSFSFEYEVCSPPADKPSTIAVKFNNSNVECLSEEVDLSFCKCMCPSEEERESWVEMTVEENGSPCGDDHCKVSVQVTVPSYYDCFTHYSYKGTSPPGVKHIIPPTGIINYTATQCIKKGDMFEVEFYLYTASNPSVAACSVKKTYNCPFEAVTPFCTPNCEATPWTDETIQVKLDSLGCPGCEVIGEFKWRRNICEIPIKQEIQVTRFAIHSPSGDSTLCSFCPIPTEQIYKEILLKAIHDNPMGFLPQSSEDACDVTWRVIQKSCWASYTSKISWNEFSSNGNALVYVPCEDSECCSIGLRVCRIPPNKVTVDTLSGSSSLDSCSNSHVDVRIEYLNPRIITLPDGAQMLQIAEVKTLDCEDRCSWLYGLKTTMPYGKQGGTEGQMHNGQNGVPHIAVKSNFDKGEINIEMISNVSVNGVDINLSSLQGLVVKSEKVNLRNGTNHFKVDGKNLENGVYFISILVDGVNISTQKIIILK